MARQINPLGLELIKEAEGCRLTAYPDPASGGAPWTIGYGHTGSDVSEGMIIPIEVAEAMLISDLARFEDGVSECVTVGVSDNAFSALVSFAYNLGIGRLRGSTLLKMLNAGNVQGAADQFMLWTMPGSSVHAGLLTRRTGERALFLTPDTIEV